MILNRKVRATSRSGFTLMEVLVAAAILVILAGVASVTVFAQLEGAKKDAARAAIDSIESAVKTFKVKHGDYPPSLDILLQPMEGLPAALEPSNLIDPWDHPYGYEPNTRSPTGRPLIYSQGPNPGDPSGRVSNF